MFLTASGIKYIEWRQAIRAAQFERIKAMKSNVSKLDMSMLRAGRAEDCRPPSESLKGFGKTSPVEEEDLDKLAEEGYGHIERRDPALPAIVQNVTQYLAVHSLELYKYIRDKEAKTGP